MSLGGSAPQPNDPLATANQQASFNKQAAEMNQAGSNINQYNPYGSVTYQQTGKGPGGIPLYSANVNLNPQQQNLLNQLVGTQGVAGADAYNLLSNAGYGSVDPATAIGTGASGISGQLMSGYLGEMEPFFQQQTQQLDTQLKNSGLGPSLTSNPHDPTSWSPYERSMYQTSTDQARQVAAAAAQFQPQAFSEATQLYQMPEQMALQLAGFGAPTSPTGSLVNAAGFNTAAPNYEGDVQHANQQQMQAWGANQALLGQALRGVGSIGGAMIGGPIGGMIGSSLGGMLSGSPGSPGMGGMLGMGPGTLSGGLT